MLCVFMEQGRLYDYVYYQKDTRGNSMRDKVKEVTRGLITSGVATMVGVLELNSSCDGNTLNSLSRRYLIRLRFQRITLPLCG